MNDVSIIPEIQNKDTLICYQNLKTKILQVTKLLRGCNYDQTAYIVSEARKNLNLKKDQRKAIVQPLTVEDFGRILSYAYNLKSTKGLMIKCLFLLGVRANEFVNLKIENFDYNKRTIFVDVAKKESQRIIPVLPALADDLKTHIGERKSGYMFLSQKPSKDGTYRYSTARVWQIVEGIARDAGVKTEHKKVYPHKLRHTIATFLLSKGMPLDEIQKFLGHKNITTTQIYAKTNIQSLQQDYNRAFESKVQ